MNEYILSICIPTYNRCEKLKITLNNLIKQIRSSGGGVQLVVSNNASTDGTADYLGSILPVSNIVINNNTRNLGYGGNVRYLFNSVRGEYFQILSDDDIYDENMIEKELDAIKNHKDVAYFYVPSKGSKKSTGKMTSYDFFCEYTMGPSLCGSNIFKKELCHEAKSDAWFHCELLFDMNPNYIYVMDDFIKNEMAMADPNYWYNKPKVVADYDTEIIYIIKHSNLEEKNKILLYNYYKKFLYMEIYNFAKCEEWHELSSKFAKRLKDVSSLSDEKDLLLGKKNIYCYCLPKIVKSKTMRVAERLKNI